MNNHIQRMVRASLAAVFVAISFSQSGCSRNSAPPPSANENEESRPVEVVQARLTPIERSVRSFGSLAAYDQATLSTEVAGRLESLRVDLGAVVRNGDVIAQIDPRDYRLQLQQAEALLAQSRARLGLPIEGDDDAIDPERMSGVRQTRALLEEARANRDRIRSLSSQQILSKSEVETAEANYEVALSRYEDALQEIRLRQALVAQRRAELEIARQRLEDTSLQAPFDGVVQERRANLGEYLSESAPVVTLVRIDPLRLRLEVSEREAPKVEVGQPVRVMLQGTTNVYVGAVKRLSPALNEQSRMLRVEADVPNPGHLRPGSFVTADIVINRTDRAVAVPADALVTFAGIEKVFVVESGRATERAIVTGQRPPGLVEVVKGLKPGETVVLNPGNMRNGQTVSVKATTYSSNTNEVVTPDYGGSE